MPRPLPSSPRPAAPIVEAAGGEATWVPPFVVHDIPPRLVDADGVLDRLERAYPPALRAAGVGGEAVVWLLIGEDGDPREVRLARSAGRTELDSVARAVSREMRFRPAFAGERAVAVWIAQPIAFRPEPTATGTGASP